MQEDFDGDSIGDFCDADDDNDGIADLAELTPDISPFCEVGFFQVLSDQLFVLEPISGTYAPIGDPTGFLYNCTGYNDLDGYIYAFARGNGTDSYSNSVANGDLIRIDPEDGTVLQISATGQTATFRSGDIYNNVLYIGRLNEIFPVDLTTGVAGSPIGSGWTCSDLSIINGIAYGVHRESGVAKLFIMDLFAASPSVTKINMPNLPGGNSYGATFVANTSELFVSYNSGGVYQITDYTTANPISTFVANSTTTGANDGASCPSAPSPFDVIDLDGDGIPNHQDLDDDNDGISENSSNSLILTGTDTNNDGTPDSYAQANADADADATPNFLDLDSDNDGITDVVENAAGISSGTFTSDNPSSGVLDGYIGVGGITDTNTNGWHDPIQGNTSILDTDGDGIPDPYDIDADNDGIVDYLEGTCSTCPTFTNPTGADANNNGILDIYEGLQDNNQYGGSNNGTIPNEDDDDGTGIPDYLDTNSDNDDGMDWAEGYDTDGDGNARPEIMAMVAAYVASGGSVSDYPNLDTDNDGLPDWLDNQPNVIGWIGTQYPPFLDANSSFWIDRDNDGLVNLFDDNITGFAHSGTSAPIPNNSGSNDHDWRDLSTSVDLPIELLSFNAKRVANHQVDLAWATATELNNKGFYVERMIQGEENFQAIAWIDGNGTSTKTNNYKHTDKNTSTKISYYRLKQIDTDGTETTTKIQAVAGEASLGTLMVAPVPVDNELNIYWDEFSNSITTGNLKIVNVTGQVVFQTTIYPKNNEQFSTTKIANLPTGIYVLELTWDNGEKLQKLFRKQ